MEDFTKKENVSKEETFYQFNRTDSSYIYIDSIENAIDSLETVNLFFAREDNLKWKWIALSLHHSLYMFCVLNLEGGNYENVVGKGKDEDSNTLIFRDGTYKKSTIEKWNNKSPGYNIIWETVAGKPETGESRRRKDEKKLISFWTALARVQDKEIYMNRLTFSKPLVLSESEKSSIEWLTNEIRNNLTHFIPMGLGIPILDIKKACLDIVNVIKRLAFDTKQIVYFEANSKGRIRVAIDKIIKNINNG